MLVQPISLFKKQVSGGAAAGALDAYTQAPLAWSLRREFGASSPTPLIEVRRSSDSATMDVSEDESGFIDVAAIESWAGSDTIYISKFYNQGTLGADADISLLAAAANFQYVLGTGGTVNVEGSNSRPYFVKSAYQYEESATALDDFVGQGLFITACSIGHPLSTSSYMVLGGGAATAATTGFYFFYVSSIGRIGWVATQNSSSISSGFHNTGGGGTTKGVGWRWDFGNEVKTYWDGVLKGTTSTFLDFSDPVSWPSGRAPTFGPSLNMKGYTLVVYDSDIGETDTIAISENMQDAWGF